MMLGRRIKLMTFPNPDIETLLMKDKLNDWKAYEFSLIVHERVFFKGIF